MLRGQLDSLRIPPAADVPAFSDGLWQHSCFEAFIAEEGTSAYREFNFSPSGDWASYAFRDYRDRIANWPVTTAPAIRQQAYADSLVVEASLPLSLLPSGTDRPLFIGLSAVIESNNGNLSYWALKHPEGKPDFHWRDAISLPLTLL